MKKQKSIILKIINILLCLLLFASCENNITSVDVSSDNKNSCETETFSIQENSIESITENKILINSEEIESTVSVSEQLSKADSPTNISSVIAFKEDDSMNTDLNSLSLSSIKEFEDWITGKNEFTDRHQQNKKEINEKDGFFDRRIYYKLDEKFTDLKFVNVEFNAAEYSMYYKSNSAIIYFECSYGEASSKLLSEDLERRKANATNIKYIDVEYNGVLYSIKESSKSGITRVIWTQDGIYMAAVFPATEYTPDLLKYCVAQKVDLNNIVK